MRNIRLIVAAVILVLLATSASHAFVLHEDNTYWYLNGKDVACETNPNDATIARIMPTALVKIEETVFDSADSLAMLQGNNDGTTHTGFLYAYAITNLGIGNPADHNDLGITAFNVNWGIQPTYVTTDKDQLSSKWEVDTSVSQPAWNWTSAVDRGIAMGRTVGGFWAVSNVSVDGECSAGIVHIGGLGQRDPWTGKTTGPCPEPATFLSLFAGITGLGLTIKLRRK